MSIRMSRALKAFALSTALITASLAPAFAAVDLFLNVAPPEDRVEVIPDARAGYIWAPGYWEWRGHQHFWMPGHWVRARAGYHWYRDRWDHESDRDRWNYHRGHWERD